MSEQLIIKPQEGPQTEFAICEADIALYGGAAGGGKALDPEEPIMTPTGMVPLKDLKIGSRVVNPDGAPCKVTGVYHHSQVEMFLVTFADNTQIKACEDHQWTAWNRHKKNGRSATLDKDLHPYSPLDLYPPSSKVINTRELARWVDKIYCPQVPVNRPLILNTSYKEEGPTINSYAKGAIHLRSVLEPLRMWKFTKDIPEPYRVEGAEANRYCRWMGLLNIPYGQRRLSSFILNGPLHDRLLFAQGLMDRHGRAGTSESTAYLTLLEDGPIVEDLLYLFRTLGCVCSIADIKNSLQLKIHVSPFIDLFPSNVDQKNRFKPAKAALGKAVKKVEPIGKGDAICISVDHPNKLYLTKNFTVTHNTYGLLLEPLKWIDVPQFQTLVFRRNRTEMTQAGGIWDESMNIYPHFQGKPTEGKLIWKFPNSVKVQMLDIEHEATLEKRKGAQVPLMLFDELSTFTERMFFYMLSRNRSTLPGIPAYARATTNPIDGTDKIGGWLRHFIDWWLDDRGYPIPERSGVIRYFVRLENKNYWADDPQELIDMYGPKYGKENVRPKSFTFIPAKLDDNKLMDPGYRSQLLAGSRFDKEQLLDGCWDVKVDAGSYFDREKVAMYETITEPVEWVRYWDRAASVPTESEPDPDYTAGALIGMGKKTNNIYIDDVIRFRLGPFEGREKIKEIAILDKKRLGRCKVAIERDPGAAGKIEAKALAVFLAGFNVVTRTTGNKDKLTRFLPFSAATGAGLVCVKKASWNEDYFRELEGFTGDGKGKDDQVDATSGGYSEHITPSFKLGQIKMPSFSKQSTMKGM